jgi:shikimate 5-dehydrogenase
MECFLPPDFWRRHKTELLCLGAGGAAVALLIHFATRTPATNRPQKLILIDRELSRLQYIEHLLRRLELAEMSVELIHNQHATSNDRLLQELPDYSVVVNATGMGKDIPGSPLTKAARYPLHGTVWELNYRGALPFLKQARAQKEERDLQVEDGWEYFILGWTMVISYVFATNVNESALAQLRSAAEEVR